MIKKVAAISLVFDFPQSLTTFSVLDVGKGKNYVDREETNNRFLTYMSSKGQYVLQELIDVCTLQEVAVGVYFSSTYLDLLATNAKPFLIKLKQCVEGRNLTLIGGTAFNSLSSLYNADQFEKEIKEHKAHLKAVFGVTPNVFYNIENSYLNDWGDVLVKSGYSLTMTGAIEWYLGRSYNSRVFQSATNKKLSIALIDENQSGALSKNTDQMQHVFQWNEQMIGDEGGLTQLISRVQSKTKIVPLSGLSKSIDKKQVYNIKVPIIGSINGYSFNSYRGNVMQSQAIKRYYALGKNIGKLSPEIQKEYMILGHADHFLQMATSFKTNGRKPYEYYNSYMNILSDLELRLED